MFGSGKQLQQHERTQHQAGGRGEESTAGSSQQPEGEEAVVVLFYCHLCDFTGASLRSVNIHRARAHGPEGSAKKKQPTQHEEGIASGHAVDEVHSAKEVHNAEEVHSAKEVHNAEEEVNTTISQQVCIGLSDL